MTKPTSSSRSNSISRVYWLLGLTLVLWAIHPISPSLEAQTQSTKTTGYTISGHVIDAESKETLIGATIFAPEIQQGSYTNSYGFFSLSLKQPIRSLRISYIGYEPQTIKIAHPSDTTLTIALKPLGQLQEVVVTDERRHLRTPQLGALEVPVHIIKTTPALLGENDLMKALQLMPGVQSGSEGSAGVHVRGGGADENLILLDGVSLYSVDHLLGFFSVFTPEAVKKVDLYKGSFPARFGGRLSSVIDVRTNDGNMQHYKGALSIGLLSSKAQIEGPIVKDRTSFNLALRRTYLDLLIKPLLENDTDGGYYFYDINAKIQHRFSDRDRLYLSIYHGLDKLYNSYSEQYKRYEEHPDGYQEAPRILDNTNHGKMNWGNTLAALRWNHVFSPKMYSDLTLAYTHYHFLFGAESRISEGGREKQRIAMDYKSGIRDLSANWNAHYFASPGSEWRFGADYIRHTFRPETYGHVFSGEELEEDISKLVTPNTRKRDDIQAHHAAIYIENKTQMLHNKIELNLGLRSALFAVSGKSYISLQPRLALDWRITPLINMTLGYARMSQNVHLLTSATMALPTDLWVPATQHHKPMVSDQVSLGANYRFADGWYASLEGYYKTMDHILDYKDGASFLGSSEGWENKVASGQGRSYGLEFIVMRQVGKTTGWVGYNLSKSERRFPDGEINRGQWYPYKYDRRHKVNLVVAHQLSNRIDLSASWEFYTGGVITLGYEKMQYIVPGENPNASMWRNTAGFIPERNNFRLPATHRLNMSINYNRFHKNGAKSVWNLSVFNLYNAKNPAFVLPDDFVSSTESRVNRVTKFTLLPLIPSLSYTYKF